MGVSFFFIEYEGGLFYLFGIVDEKVNYYIWYYFVLCILLVYFVLKYVFEILNWIFVCLKKFYKNWVIKFVEY